MSSSCRTVTQSVCLFIVTQWYVLSTTLSLALLLPSVNTPTCHAHNMNEQNCIFNLCKWIQESRQISDTLSWLYVEYIHISMNYDDVLTCYCWLESWEILESSSWECKSHVDNLRPVYLLLLQVLHIPGNTNQINKDAVEHTVLKFISTHSLL